MFKGPFLFFHGLRTYYFLKQDRVPSFMYYSLFIHLLDERHCCLQVLQLTSVKHPSSGFYVDISFQILWVKGRNTWGNIRKILFLNMRYVLILSERDWWSKRGDGMEWNEMLCTVISITTTWHLMRATLVWAPISFVPHFCPTSKS